MRRCALWIVLALTPASAFGQTSCQWIGPVWTCNQQQQAPSVDWSILQRQNQAPAPNTYNDIMRGAAEQEAANARAKAARKSLSDNQNARALREAVGGLVAEGHCERATKLSLEQGDFALAHEVQQFCHDAGSVAPQ